MTFKEDYSIADIDEKIVPVIEEVTGDPNVQTQKIEGSKQVVIKTRSLELSEREAVNQALIDKFGVDQDEIVAENISSTISSEMRSDAAWAVIIATICMLIYIWFRFKDIRFAGSAVLALVHDVLVVLAFYAIVRISVGNTFIACMLTIVGYFISHIRQFCNSPRLLSFLNKFYFKHIPQGAGYTYRRICSADNACHQRKRKLPDGANAQNEQHKYHDKGCQRGINARRSMGGDYRYHLYADLYLVPF